MNDQLVYNSIQTPDGTVLESRYTHDYRTYKDTVSGETYMVDGGLSYRRRNVNKVPYRELSLSLSSPHEEIRKVVQWGSRGVDGKQPLTYRPICELDYDHIVAIVGGGWATGVYAEVMLNELKYRQGKDND